jgi:hypothetical protein
VSRVVITKACVLPTLSNEKLKVGDVLECTPAQLTAIGTAGGTTRAVSNSGAAAGMRDQLGEAFAASNASP